MKKILLSVACLLLLADSVSAQYYRPRQRHPRRQQQQQTRNDFNTVKFGIVAGVNVANVVDVNNANFNTGTIAGFNGGLDLDIPIHYPFIFEPEVLYSGKGFTAQTDGYGQFTQRTNWIDVPLLLKIKAAPGFNFVAGPQIQFLLSTQNTYDNGYNLATQTTYNNAADGYSKTVVGGVFGISFDLSPNVELRARYNIDLQSTTIQGVTNNPNYNNQVFQFGLGFKFF